MKITENGYLMESTGRLAKDYGTAHIGLYKWNEDRADKFDVGMGYDQGWEFDKNEEDNYMRRLHFTKEEKAELADYMIDLWTQFKNS